MKNLLQIIKWGYYILLAGILPILFRLLVFFVLDGNSNFKYLQISDFIILGIVICGFNINNIELINIKHNPHKWITHTNALSWASSLIFSALLMADLFINRISSSEKTHPQIIIYISSFFLIGMIILTIISYKNLNFISNE